ncbi:MAG TPA: hypothetical protein VH593_27230, partial [Ktedonobacteraceae bacterium]
MGIQYDPQPAQEDEHPSISEQQTIAQPLGPPLQPPPHPPSRSPHRKRERWFIATLIVVLVLFVAIGTVFAVQVLTRPDTQPTPVPTVATHPTPVPTRVSTPTLVPTRVPTPTSGPGVILGPQACPANLGSSARWDAIIGTDNVESFVQGVSCANIMGDPSLQAMVLVRHTNSGATLDVYV